MRALTFNFLFTDAFYADSPWLVYVLWKSLLELSEIFLVLSTEKPEIFMIAW